MTPLPRSQHTGPRWCGRLAPPRAEATPEVASPLASFDPGNVDELKVSLLELLDGLNRGSALHAHTTPQPLPTLLRDICSADTPSLFAGKGWAPAPTSLSASAS